jgi:hypothetical protein
MPRLNRNMAESSIGVLAVVVDRAVAFRRGWMETAGRKMTGSDPANVGHPAECGIAVRTTVINPNGEISNQSVPDFSI